MNTARSFLAKQSPEVRDKIVYKNLMRLLKFRDPPSRREAFSAANVRRWIACLALLVEACSPAAAPTPTIQAATSAAAATTAAPAPAAPTAIPTSAPAAKFPAGLYILRPSLQHPGGIVELVDASGGTVPNVEIFGQGWDLGPDLIAGPTPQIDGLTLISPNGTSRLLKIPGLYGIGRPALSPDGKQAIVQASETAFAPGVPRTALDDTVYVVDLATAAFRRIGDKAAGPSTQSEQPAWFPSGDRVAYWTTESDCLVIKVREVATAKDAITIRRGGISGCYQPQRGILDGPRFHVSISRDSSRLLIPGQLQVYDAKTGALLADVHQPALDALAAAGYKPDARFPGQAMAGTFPLDGALSPDNRQIVFDGAVEKGGQFGVLLCRINVDGSGFTVLKGPIQVEPRFSNNHNYSQLLPRWR